MGSIVAAIAAVHTDSELRTLYSTIEDFNLSFFANNSVLDAMVHLMTKGSLQGMCHRIETIVVAILNKSSTLSVQQLLFDIFRLLESVCSLVLGTHGDVTCFPLYLLINCNRYLCLADITFLVRRLRQLLADITFLEAYERTNRFLNVTVTAADTNEPPRMLNYLTAPHVVIWSAVACSSAFPGLFPAQELLARDSNGKFVKCASAELPFVWTSARFCLWAHPRIMHVFMGDNVFKSDMLSSFLLVYCCMCGFSIFFTVVCWFQLFILLEANSV